MKNAVSADITDARIYTPDGIVERGVLQIRAGKIDAITTLDRWSRDASGTISVYDAGGAELVPGFVDVHVHGGGGFDFMSDDPAQLAQICAFHASRGTTSLLATTLTAPHEDLKTAIRSIVRTMRDGSGGADGPAGAEIAGIHLEGPYLNPARCGAQNPEHIRHADLAELTEYVQLAEGHLRLVTLAPEIPGGFEAINYLRANGVTVSIGHSDAHYDLVVQAAEAGVSHVTHLFNGMRPLHHREPGVAGAALMLPELTVEMICDGIHIHPELVKYVWETKPKSRQVFVTDCIAACGLPDGRYTIGGLDCALHEGIVRLVNADGTMGSLSGSTLTLDRSLKNIMKWTNCTVEEALPALTVNPARQAGILAAKGTIEPGKDADFVLLDNDYCIKETWVSGAKIWG